MKKIKLFALAAFAMLSTNAFADVAYVVDDNGIRYSYEEGAGTAANPYKAKVCAVKTALGADKAITISATFTAKDAEKNDIIFNVVGFADNWSHAGDPYKDVTGTLEKLTVNADNFTGAAVGTAALTGLTALKEYTVIDSKATRTITDPSITGDVLGTITKIDIEKTAATLVDNHFAVVGTSLKKLVEVKLPSALTAIPAGCFKNSSITSITIPATVTSIGQEAFQGAAITTIDIPEAVTAIGKAAFSSCADLATVTGMKGMDMVANGQFSYCEKLTTITLPEGITALYANAFAGCTALESVVFEGEIAAVNNKAFEDCEALASLDFSKATLTGFGVGAFAGCSSLATIALPETLTTLEDDVFKDAVLTSLDLSATAVEDLNKIFGTIADAKKAYSSLTSLILPATLKKIKSKALNYCTGLTEIALPDGLLEIETEAFSNCTGLTEITLPASLTADIPAKAFYNCTGLKTVNYEPTVGAAKEFNEQAFLGCKPYIKINTNKYYFQEHGYEAPLNTKFFDDAALSVTTVADAGTSGKYFAKYCPVMNVTILPADLSETGGKIFSVYEDEGAIYLTRIRVKGGKYQIPAYAHLIIKSDVEATYTFTSAGATISSSVDEDQICPANNEEDITLENYQTIKYLNDDNEFVGAGTKSYIEAGYKYLYALTNKAPYGFGFTEFTGTKLKKGGFFLPSTVAPAAGGRLNVIWVDDEDEATGINNIVAKNAQNDVIYNLAGQKVSASYKGIVIKNGKKTIMK